MRRTAFAGTVLCLGLTLGVVSLFGQGGSMVRGWWSPGSGERLPALITYANPNGALGLLSADG